MLRCSLFYNDLIEDEDTRCQHPVIVTDLATCVDFDATNSDYVECSWIITLPLGMVHIYVYWIYIVTVNDIIIIEHL